MLTFFVKIDLKRKLTSIAHYGNRVKARSREVMGFHQQK